jgi:hypothetical protein
MIFKYGALELHYRIWLLNRSKNSTYPDCGQRLLSLLLEWKSVRSCHAVVAVHHRLLGLVRATRFPFATSVGGPACFAALAVRLATVLADRFLNVHGVPIHRRLVVVGKAVRF